MAVTGKCGVSDTLLYCDATNVTEYEEICFYGFGIDGVTIYWN
jgi:hypothetical protein